LGGDGCRDEQRRESDSHRQRGAALYGPPFAGA
jgi:hypothetical protein